MATAAAQIELPAAVETFLRRALPHFMAGQTAEQAMRSVLDDDARLLTAVVVPVRHLWCGDFIGSRSMPAGREEGLVSAISAEVHSKLRAGHSA